MYIETIYIHTIYIHTLYIYIHYIYIYVYIETIYTHSIYIYVYIYMYIIYILSPHHRLNQIPKDPYCDGALAPALALRRPGSNRAHCEGSGHERRWFPGSNVFNQNINGWER